MTNIIFNIPLMNTSFYTFKVSLVRMSLLFMLLLCGGFSYSQVTLTLDYQAKTGTPTSVKSGEYWTMTLDYAVSSTFSSTISGVKITIPLPDNILDAEGMAGTSHAPLSNFVFDGTPGAKKLTITFVDPVSSGSNGVLEFRLRSTNGNVQDGTVINTCATLTDGDGNSSGSKCNDMTITAQNLWCAKKTLKSGGGIGVPTTYRIAIATNFDYPNSVSAGVLNASNISITDTYPAGATYIGAQVVDQSGQAVTSTITQGTNSVTATIPDYIIDNTCPFGGCGGKVAPYFLEVTVQYDSQNFSSGNSVTNTASVTLTPLGGSPTTLTNGTNNGVCTNDLEETHTLQEAQITANLMKSRSSGYPENVNSGAEVAYDFGFTNTGNVALNNVEIIETIPPQLIYKNMRLDALTFQITGIEYQTNQNGWTAWPAPTLENNPPPPLASGEVITKIKFILATPYASNVAFRGYNILKFTAATVTTATPVTNCLAWTASNSGLPSNLETCNTAYTINPTATTASIRYESGNSPSCNAPYSIGTEMTLSGTIRANIGFAAIENPVVGYLVRSGAQYVTGSETFTPSTSGITGTPTFTVTSNYVTINSISYDLLRWTFPTGTTVPTGTNFSISVKVKLTNLLPPDQNIQFLLMADGSNISVYEPRQNANLNFTDTNDWDGDNNTTEEVKTSNASFMSCSSWLGASAEMESIKWVKGLCDTDYSRYPASGQTVPGGNADYKLIITNKGNIPMTNLVVVDILPFIGDAGVVTFNQRGTAWRPNLAGPISGTGATVYYSTVGNPCRPELNITAPGCVAPNWSTSPPADITTVQSVKLEFGNAVVQPGQSFEFSWPMRAPVNAPTNGEIAWNSFGFTATRTDNNEALLAAEPPQVGIKVKPGAPAFYGNLVWLDTNKNGIQDSGEVGIDGVIVTLYKSTGEVVNFTVTGNGGLYRFSNLQPGDYYAVFTPPAGYSISPKNAPGSTADNDSDGELVSGGLRTATTTLDAAEDDPSWDQGFYLPTVCVTPTAGTPVATKATCNTAGTAANSDAMISIPTVTNATVYAYTTDGTTPVFANATAISGGAINLTGLPNPSTTTIYKFRIFNADADCYLDVQVSLEPTVCVPTCVKPNAGADQTVCAGTSATLTGTAPTTGTWSAQAGNPAGATLGTTTGGIATVAFATTATGTYKFIYNISADCEDTMTITVNPKPVIADGAAAICAGETVDLTSKITSYSTLLNPTWTAGGTAVATPTAVKPTANTTYVLIAENSFGCKDTANVVVTVNPKPNAGNDQTLACADAAANTLTTTTTLVPTPTGGTWAQIGTTPATATITGNNVTGMSVAGTYQFVYTLNGCKDTVAVIVEPCTGCVKPNAGPDAAAICQPTATAKLTAVTAGGTWAPIGSPANPAAATIDASGNISGMTAAGTYKFVYSVTGGGITCTDTAQVVVNPKPNAGTDQSVCSPTATATLSATPTGGTWAAQTGNPAPATVSSTGAVTGMTSVGVYNFIYTLNGCSDTVAVTVKAKPNAGPDQTLACANAATNTLTTSTTLVPTPTGGTWAQIGTTPATATITGNNVTGMSVAGTYQFVYTLNGCIDTVAVIVQPCTGCVKPNAGADQSVCAPTATATLTATPTGGTWSALTSNPATATVSAAGAVSGMSANGVYKFIYSVTSGGQTCTDTVQITRNAKPVVGDATICSPATTATVTLTPTGGTWSAMAGNPATATVSATGAVSGLTADGTYRFIYTVNGCSDTSTVIRNAKPNAGNDQTLACADAAANTLTTSTTLVPTPTGGTWAQIGTTPATATITGNNVTGMTVAGTYQFVYTLNGCSDTVAVTVSPCAGCIKPNAGPDIALTCPTTGIAPTTAQLTAVTTGGSWSAMTGNPATATVTTAGAVSGMSVAGTYQFIYSVTAGGQTCTDTAAVIVPTCVVPKGSLGDYVWKDANNNGIQGDAGDSPVKGVILELYKNGVATGITDTTDALGKYLFVISDSASYQVQILATSLPANCSISTLQNAGSDDTKDSDFNPTTGRSDAVVVNPLNPLKRDVLTVDAALVTPCVPSTITITTPAACSANYATYSVTVSVANPLTNTLKVNAGTVSGSNPYTISGIPIGTNLIVVDSLNATCKTALTVTAPNCNCTPALPVLLTPSMTVCAGDTFPTLKATVIGLATVEWFTQATGGTAVATGLSYKPAGVVPAVGDTLWAQARSTDPTCPTAISSARVPVYINAQNCEKIVDLALKKSINTKIAQIGNEVTYTIKVYNQSNTGATGVEVRDTIATSVQFVTGSLVASRGSANIVGNVISWNIGNIAANGDTVTLTYKVKAIAAGIHYNTAEISKVNEKDVDSTPSNGKPNEDDIDNQCFTVPFKLCPGEKVQASVPSTLTNVQWFKNGSATPIATGNVVLLSEVGTYTFTATNNTCPASGCCPVIIEPSQNCCPVNLCVPVTIRKIKK